MWGELVDPEQINFEWPTQEMLDFMPNDVSLKSITFHKWEEGDVLG